MKIINAIIFLAALSIVNSAYSLERIQAKDAHANVGSYVEACGVVVSTKYFKKGVYLNFDKPYPNQTLVAVVWDDAAPGVIKSFGGLSNLHGKNICVEGVVTAYKNNMQISVNDPSKVR